jgi:hypothetical protein
MAKLRDLGRLVIGHTSNVHLVIGNAARTWGNSRIEFYESGALLTATLVESVLLRDQGGVSKLYSGRVRFDASGIVVSKN